MHSGAVRDIQQPSMLEAELTYFESGKGDRIPHFRQRRLGHWTVED